MVHHIAGNIAIIRAFFDRHLQQVRISPSEGSFVIWIDWRSLGLDSNQLSRFLVEDACLILGPGEHYGSLQTGFTRMSVATSRTMLTRSLDLLLKAVTDRDFAV